MKRPLLVLILLSSLIFISLYQFNEYWIHRFDALIVRQAAVYKLDPELVWSVIYEETYFRPGRIGGDGEIGLMQVMPVVGREWAAETGMRELEELMEKDPKTILSDPERNIQIGCWYLNKISKSYRDLDKAEARILAAYNAGPSRATEWNQTTGPHPLTEEAFISRIDISSTRAYVTSILSRYRNLKRANRR
jgi:soluble lytic murein transglycosylase